MMAKEEAVEPEDQSRQGTKIEADPDKLIVMLRQENEELRHQLRIMQVAYGDLATASSSLRGEIDALALQIEDNKMGKPTTKKTNSINNGTGAKK